MTLAFFAMSLLLSAWGIIHAALSLHHLGSDTPIQIARSFGHGVMALVTAALLIWIWL